MIRVEIVDPADTSHCYYIMSQVPRIGDTVAILPDDVDRDETDWIEGVVVQVKWLLDSRDYGSDNADCVVVTLADTKGE